MQEFYLFGMLLVVCMLCLDEGVVDVVDVVELVGVFGIGMLQCVFVILCVLVGMQQDGVCVMYFVKVVGFMQGIVYWIL